MLKGSGIESIYAVAIPVTRFVAPGPEVAIHTPTLWERKLGGRLVTIIVEGDVSAVTEAVNAAATGAIKKPVSYAVIARPHEEIVRMVELSASRWKNNQGDE